jgi:hypothetical protein
MVAITAAASSSIIVIITIVMISAAGTQVPLDEDRVHDGGQHRSLSFLYPRRGMDVHDVLDDILLSALMILEIRCNRGPTA